MKIFISNKLLIINQRWSTAQRANPTSLASQAYHLINMNWTPLTLTKTCSQLYLAMFCVITWTYHTFRALQIIAEVQHKAWTMWEAQNDPSWPRPGGPDGISLNSNWEWPLLLWICHYTTRFILLCHTIIRDNQTPFTTFVKIVNESSYIYYLLIILACMP
jgi:hypothetical protein